MASTTRSTPRPQTLVFCIALVLLVPVTCIGAPLALLQQQREIAQTVLLECTAGTPSEPRCVELMPNVRDLGRFRGECGDTSEVSILEQRIEFAIWQLGQGWFVGQSEFSGTFEAAHCSGEFELELSRHGERVEVRALRLRPRRAG